MSSAAAGDTGGSAVVRVEAHVGEDARGDDGGGALALEQLATRSVLLMAKDKYQTRTLQQSLTLGGPEVVQHILGEVTPEFLELVQDQYANYMCQKLLEVVSAEQFDALFGILEGHLRALVDIVHGSRTVQKLVEQAIVRGRVSELLAALPVDLQETMARSMTGFHVVAKLVERLPPPEAEVLLDRLCGTPEKAADLGSDQWGCCVLKKCLDRATGATKDQLVGAVTARSPSLVQDPFGNYVVQHLIINHAAGLLPVSPHVEGIIDALKGQIFDLCQHKFSSNVLEKCLLHSGEQGRSKIVNEILSPPSCPPSEGVRVLIFHEYGNYVFQRALELSREPQHSLLMELAKAPVQEAVRAAMSCEPPPEPEDGLLGSGEGGLARVLTPFQGAGRPCSEATEPPGLRPAPALLSELLHEDGNLPVLQCRRLAAKLVKRYPPLAEGLDLDLLGAGMWDAHLWDPGAYAAECFGTGAFGMGDWAAGPMAPMTVASLWEQWGARGPMPQWGPGFGAYPTAHPPPRGRGGGRGAKGGRQGKGSKGRARGHATGEAPGPGGGAGGSMPVGHITGFWPHYTVTYGEVPASALGKGRGGRGSSQGRGRGLQGAKVDAAAAVEAGGPPNAGT